MVNYKVFLFIKIILIQDFVYFLKIKPSINDLKKSMILAQTDATSNNQIYAFVIISENLYYLKIIFN